MALDFKEAGDDFTESVPAKPCEKIAVSRSGNERESRLVRGEFVERASALTQTRLVLVAVDDGNRALHVLYHFVARERAMIRRRRARLSMMPIHQRLQPRIERSQQQDRL